MAPPTHALVIVIVIVFDGGSGFEFFRFFPAERTTGGEGQIYYVISALKNIYREPPPLKSTTAATSLAFGDRTESTDRQKNKKSIKIKTKI